MRTLAKLTGILLLAPMFVAVFGAYVLGHIITAGWDWWTSRFRRMDERINGGK